MIDALALGHPLEETVRVRRSRRALCTMVVALCAGWALSSACAATTPTWRSVAERHWIELRSESFVLSTDLPRATALERFRELEDIRGVLLARLALAPGPRAQMQPFRIIHLARCSDLAAARQSTAGAFIAKARDFSDTRLMVTCDGTRERRAWIVHDMVHALLAAHFPRLQPWLSEGLASYFQTLRVETNSTVIGMPPHGYLKAPLDAGAAGTFQVIRDRGPTKFEGLLSMTEAFYREEPFYNYGDACTLVHLLNSPPHRARFVSYLRGLRAGARADDAWRAAFGDVGLRAMEAAYQGYARRMAVQEYRIGRAPLAAFRAPAVEAMRPGDVHALWIRIYMARAPAEAGSVDRNAIREHLSAMAREDPAWDGILFWRAVEEYYTEGEAGRARAERLLRGYTARQARDARGRAALVRIAIDRAVPRGDTGTLRTTVAGLARAQPDVRELLRHGDTSEALDLIGRYYALRGLPRTGLAFSFRAVRADPACGACYDTLGALLYQDGRVADAVEAEGRALSLLAEDGARSDVLRRLELYRRARPPQSR